MITVNALGKACPEPVVMTKGELEKGASELTVLVDNAVAVANVTRLLEGQGFQVQLQEGDGEFRLIARKGTPSTSEAPSPKGEHPQGGPPVSPS